MTKSTAAFSARITALAIFQALHGVSIFHAVAHLAGPETAALSPHSRESHPLQGLVHAVLKIHEDQHQYFKFSALLKSRLNSQADVATIHELVSAAVEAEQALIADMFQLSGGSLALCGRTVSKDTLLRRIEFLADACLADLGIAGIYGVQDPLPWIAALVEREARKSERPVVQAAQSAAAPVQKMDSGEIAFTLDEDF
nr:hypothetical protein HK105_003129 [Polyrhizophydium stewartii]